MSSPELSAVSRTFLFTDVVRSRQARAEVAVKPGSDAHSTRSQGAPATTEHSNPVDLSVPTGTKPPSECRDTRQIVAGYHPTEPYSSPYFARPVPYHNEFSEHTPYRGRNLFFPLHRGGRGRFKRRGRGAQYQSPFQSFEPPPSHTGPEYSRWTPGPVRGPLPFRGHIRHTVEETSGQDLRTGLNRKRDSN